MIEKLNDDLTKIKELYPQLRDKGKFADTVATDLNRSAEHVRIRWFHLWAIPVTKQKRVLELLEKVIQLQKQFEKDYNELITH